MSYAYRARKKAIKRHMHENPEKLHFGKIKAVDFAYLQANWTRIIDGPCIGTLEQLICRKE